jgi:pimeloyl-ACP methyl ester carboxylesterase
MSTPAQHFCHCFTVGAGFHSMAYVQWDVPSNNPHKPLLCVHGLTRNGRDFDFVAKYLADTQNFTVYSPDVIGRGKSDFLPADQFAQYNNPNYATHMVSLISRITKENEKIDYFGTSMGGIIGMILAASPNAPIKRLILNDIGPVIKLSALKRIGTSLETKNSFSSVEEAKNALKERYKTFGMTTEEEWDHFVKHTVKQVDNEFVLHYDSNMKKAFVVPESDILLWSLWDAIKCPVLLLRGKESDIIDQAIVEEMKMRGPKDFTVVEFDGIGHAPMVYIQEQIKHVADWLQRTEQ